MTREEWELHCVAVKEQMRLHVPKFTTPISMTEDRTSGVAWGSGGYFRNGETTWLITADHVFDGVPEDALLAHLPVPDDHYVGITLPPQRAAHPVDIAVVKVSPIPAASNAQAAPKGFFADRFAAVKDELLFWVGYPGYNLVRHDPVVAERIKATLFDELRIPALPMLSQEFPSDELSHSLFDPQKHVAIHYPSMAKREADGPEQDLPHPKGLSGSLLWNTRYLETVQAKRAWTPEMAQICGVVWFALDKPDVVFATKIEIARQRFPEVFV